MIFYVTFNVRRSFIILRICQKDHLIQTSCITDTCFMHRSSFLINAKRYLTRDRIPLALMAHLFAFIKFFRFRRKTLKWYYCLLFFPVFCTRHFSEVTGWIDLKLSNWMFNHMNLFVFVRFLCDSIVIIPPPPPHFFILAISQRWLDRLIEISRVSVLL